MQKPTLTVTEFARQRVGEVRANRGLPEAPVRISIVGREDGRFQYDLQLVRPGEEHEGDVVVDESGGIVFHLPLSTAPYMNGVTVDADPASGALRVDNPNPLWLDPLAERVQAYLDAELNPYVASHGGHIDLLDVAEGVAYVHMGGGCQGCGMASVTLGQGIRAALLENFPEVTEVRDTTDHAQGTNPYYRAAKK